MDRNGAKIRRSIRSEICSVFLLEVRIVLMVCAALVCVGFPRAQAQEHPEKSTLGIATYLHAGKVEPRKRFFRVHADGNGVREVDLVAHRFSPTSEVWISFSDSIRRQFGHTRLDRTIETQLDIRFRALDSFRNLWESRIQSLRTRQDIDNAWYVDPALQEEHRAHAFSHSWSRWLNRNWSLRIFAGLARCQEFRSERKRFFPVGGVDVKTRFDWGEITGSILQVVHGGGTLTGIYGSQTEQRAELQGRFFLLKGLELNWNAGISMARGAFSRRDILGKAPVVTAGLGLTYRLSENLQGSVGYMHRRILGGSDLSHGHEGPVALASLRYAIF